MSSSITLAEPINTVATVKTSKVQPKPVEVPMVWSAHNQWQLECMLIDQAKNRDEIPYDEIYPSPPNANDAWVPAALLPQKTIQAAKAEREKLAKLMEKRKALAQLEQNIAVEKKDKVVGKQGKKGMDKVHKVKKSAKV